MAEPVTAERRGHVQVITISRPEARNALDGAAARALAAARAQADWTVAEGWQRQEELYKPVFDSADAREGAAAFAEKRPPAWKGA